MVDIYNSNKNLKKRQVPIAITALICQIKSQYKNIEGNISRIQKSLQKYSKNDNFDIIIMPEMALTGYNFENKEEIKPYLEESEKGQTFKFLKETAQNFQSYVVCGYPELYIDPETKEEIYYNACYVIDREGKLICNYRKTQLFETDKLWANEGQGFQSFELKNCQGVSFKAGIGICMDIQPYEFQDFSKFELADYLKSQDIDLLLFPTAWNDHEPNNNTQSSIDAIQNYWLHRLSPLINNQYQPDNYHKSWAFLISNRVGEEINSVRNTSKYLNDQNTVFMGSSACIKLNPYENVYTLDKRKEGYIKAEIKLE